MLIILLFDLIPLRDAIQGITGQRSDSNTIITDSEGGIPQSLEHKAQSTIPVTR